MSICVGRLLAASSTLCALTQTPVVPAPRAERMRQLVTEPRHESGTQAPGQKSSARLTDAPGFAKCPTALTTLQCCGTQHTEQWALSGKICLQTPYSTRVVHPTVLALPCRIIVTQIQDKNV